MRQVQQAAVALARAMHLRRNGQTEAAMDSLNISLRSVGDLDLQWLVTASRIEVSQTLEGTGGFDIHRMLAIADVLFEYSQVLESRESDLLAIARRRASWLYEECAGAGGTLPLHIYHRILSNSEDVQPGIGLSESSFRNTSHKGD